MAQQILIVTSGVKYADF